MSNSQPDPTQFVHKLRQIYPQLTIQRVQFDQSGQSNDVLIVNDEYIFRFPRRPEGIEELRREVALLQHLQDKLTLTIPNPIFQHLDTSTIGEACMGYAMLPGHPLWLESFWKIQDSIALGHMAQQLAGFLRELHSTPITPFQSINLPLADQSQGWHDLYTRIQQALFPHMHTTGRAEVTAHFEEYFTNPLRYHFAPVLRHGDFGTGNLLYDPASHTISGVIDFGATTLGDPAIDFAGLLSFGEAFCRHCYRVYPELEAMLPRVRFYRGTFALQEALYGIESGDEAAFASGMKRYR